MARIFLCVLIIMTTGNNGLMIRWRFAVAATDAMIKMDVGVRERDKRASEHRRVLESSLYEEGSHSCTRTFSARDFF